MLVLGCQQRKPSVGARVFACNRGNVVAKLWPSMTNATLLLVDNHLASHR